MEIQQAMEVLQVLQSDSAQLTTFESQEDKEMAFRIIDSLTAILERRTLQNRDPEERVSEADD